MTLEIERSDSSPGGCRWNLIAVCAEWPHRRFLRRLPTKRAAAAIVAMHGAKCADRKNADTFLADARRNWTRLGHSEAVAREEAATALRGLLSALGVPQPEWWHDWAREEKTAIDALK